MQSKGKIVTAATCDNIVDRTATKIVKVYLERRAAKEASQYPSSMLESSVPNVMTDEASATKGAGGTISPQTSSSACTMRSSSPMASSTWSIEYPRTVDKAVTSDRATGPLTRSSESYSPLLPQITYSQSGYTRPPHDGTSCINKRPKLAPTPCEARCTPTTLTFDLPMTGPVVVPMSNHTAMTGAIAAQRYQELSLRLQQEYYQSLPKSSVDHPSSLESSMPKLKEHRMTRLRSALVMTDNVPKSRASSISSSESQRDPTVSFRSIMDRSSRREEMGLAPVNVTYKGSDKVASWRHSVMETMEGTTSPLSEYAPSYPATSIGCPPCSTTSIGCSPDSDEDASSVLLFVRSSHDYPKTTEMDSNSDGEWESEVCETLSDDGLGPPIEVDLTIYVPPEVIKDHHALALVQVVPPDTNISDVPETWGIYDLDVSGDPSGDGEELDGPCDGQYDYEEEPTLDPHTPSSDQEEIYDEPGEGSYYADGPDEGHDFNFESSVSYSDGE